MKKKPDVVVVLLFFVLSCWMVSLALFACNSVGATRIPLRAIGMLVLGPWALYMLFFIGVIVAYMMGHDIDRPRRTSRKKGR